MYTIYGQDTKVEHYLKPQIMDGYIKRVDYLYITTGYLQFDKTLAYNSSDEDISDEDSSNEGNYAVK